MACQTSASGERVKLAVEVYTKPVASVELTPPGLDLWLKCGTSHIGILG